MSQRTDVEQTSAAPSCDAKSTPNDDTPAGEPKVEAKADAPASEPKIEPVKGDARKVEPPRIESPSIAPAPAAACVAAESVEPKVEALKPKFERRSAERAAPATNDRVVTLFAPTARDESASSHPSKFALLAASVALASAFGALVGVLCAGSLMSAPASTELASAAAAVPESALQSEIAQMRTDLAAIRAGVETVTRSTTAQLTKVAERIEKSERAQAEPAAKLTKAIEALERLERRADGSKEVTGSVATPQPAIVAVIPPRPPQPVQPAQPAIVPGWTLQDVYRGVALIQGGRYGIMEVEAGDVVPGLGRIEAIRKQDGRWVVVTPKGLIVAAR